MQKCYDPAHISDLMIILGTRLVGIHETLKQSRWISLVLFCYPGSYWIGN
jgi:hypothetical protein